MNLKSTICRARRVINARKCLLLVLCELLYYADNQSSPVLSSSNLGGAGVSQAWSLCALQYEQRERTINERGRVTVDSPDMQRPPWRADYQRRASISDDYALVSLQCQ